MDNSGGFPVYCFGKVIAAFVAERYVMSIKIINLNVSFDDKEVIKDLALELPDQGVVSIFGPSGAGKTTLFNCLAGLITPDSGQIIGLENKKLSMVFQENRLLPWFSALKNVAFVINGDEEKARRALSWLELSDAADKLPDELSGGMQRRVAVARALAYGGDVLLLDEPNAGLDESLAERMMSRILEQWSGRLVMLITHDSSLVEKFADYRYDLS